MKSSQKIFVGDFETTTSENDCRVWSWFWIELGEHMPLWGTDIQSFIEELSRVDCVTYFHNLKFDAMFILDHIMRNGFEWVADRKYLQANQFTTLIDRTGKFYSVTIMWGNGRVSELRDSYKKLPFKVEHIARAFKLDTLKGEIDYKKHRPVGYIPDTNELEYGFNDVRIVASALKTQFDNGLTKLTTGSDALSNFKKMTGGNTHFTNLFPVLDSDIDNDIRDSYRGGYTYADPRFKGRKVGAGKVYDVNSLYPSVMYDQLLPFGEPRFTAGLPKTTDLRPLFIVSVTFTAHLKKDHLPILQHGKSGMFAFAEYVDEINEPTTMTFTNVDWDLVQEHYHVNILSYNGGYTFTAARGMFCEYIDYWADIKANSTGAMRELAKLMLNSLYGKFATNPLITPKIPYLCEEKNIVRLKLGEEDTRDPIYTAMGSFITAYARRIMITTAQKNYDHFAYCDTDSMHLLTLDDPVDTVIHPSDLGTWKCEGEFDAAFYMRPKAYMEHMVRDDKDNPIPDVDNADGSNPSYDVHIAGVPRDIASTLRFDDLVTGLKIEGKLQPKTVPGGIVLSEVEFTLNF